MKIIHISDLHFGLHRQEIIHGFLIEAAAIQPEIIIISGDLTHRARSEQFRDLKAFISRLPGKILIVPGNHDVPAFDLIQRFLTPFDKYRHFISNSMEVSYENESVRILGLNSVNPYSIKDGKLSSDSLKKIETYFSEAANKLNILFFHHNFQHFEGLHRPLSNTSEFIKSLKKSAVHLICTGHLHYANVSFLEKNDQESFALLHAGSLSCQRTCDDRNSFYLIEIESGECTIELRAYEPNRFNRKEIHYYRF
ncbi:3',5'-cyclic-nucleotide phosphodiesterase [Legionella quinlivanii]|uniref:3',5'-cyclic-nucleotide phosphodiesterase n=1 Tax=Legionella quinlivanii TaxID=45073 RepID=A0A0W0Y3Q1_9GAMM|nr:metallophosphoesterase [Legionella quinlivanii]KTD51608.1 3',5'-cyclic-nucleotide phosphodiesterase [Legionella quinlivanii]SEF60572.1 3',5'-cyclic AMP phosphodiesterase CpdA [Legionella quinlivanii DSM 21216]STY10865.1 3',5'-cyclic-nucleotide phosphodiesterase [Legionella quinlivanii]